MAKRKMPAGLAKFMKNKPKKAKAALKKGGKKSSHKSR